MRHRLPSALAVVVALAAAGFAAAPAAAAPDLTPEPTDSYDNRVFDADDCITFCLYDERGFTAGRIDAEGRTVSFQTGCTDFEFDLAELYLRGGRLELEGSGSRYDLPSVLNASSAINRCPFPVRLLREDGTGPTVWPGQWIWDLGAAPYRINDRVDTIEPA